MSSAGCTPRPGKRWHTEFQVNSTISYKQGSFDVGALEDGGFVVVWTELTSNSDIFGRAMTSLDQPVGPTFQANTYNTNDQIAPRVAALTEIGFVVVWVSYKQACSSCQNDVYGQKFLSDGTKIGPEFLVNTTMVNNQYQLSIASFSDHRFAVAWADWVGGVYRISWKIFGFSTEF